MKRTLLSLLLCLGLNSYGETVIDGQSETDLFFEQFNSWVATNNIPPRLHALEVRTNAWNQASVDATYAVSWISTNTGAGGSNAWAWVQVNSNGVNYVFSRTNIWDYIAAHGITNGTPGTQTNLAAYFNDAGFVVTNDTHNLVFSNLIVNGLFALQPGQKQLIISNDTADQVTIATTAGRGTNSIIIGFHAMEIDSDIVGKFGTVALGHEAGRYVTNSPESTFIGYDAGYAAANCHESLMIGINAGAYASNANSVIMLGADAGEFATGSGGAIMEGFSTGKNADNSPNIDLLGFQAGFNASNSQHAIMHGYDSGYNADHSQYLFLSGYQAGYGANNSPYSLMLGYKAGYNSANSANSIFLGREAGADIVGSYTLAIDSNTNFSRTTNALIYGEFDNRVLRINGNLYVTGTIFSAFINGMSNNLIAYADGVSNNVLAQAAQDATTKADNASNGAIRVSEAYTDTAITNATGEQGFVHLSGTGTNRISFARSYNVPPTPIIQTASNATYMITYDLVASTTTNATFLARNSGGLEINTSIVAAWMIPFSATNYIVNPQVDWGQIGGLISDQADLGSALVSLSNNVLAVVYGSNYLTAANFASYPTNLWNSGITNIIITEGTSNWVTIASNIASFTFKTNYASASTDTFTPYIIPYDTNVILNLSDGNLQYYGPTNASVFNMPAAPSNSVGLVRVEFQPGTNSLTIGTSNVSGVASLTITNAGVSSVLFDKPYNQSTWKAKNL